MAAGISKKMEWRAKGFTVGKTARSRETDDEEWLVEMAQAWGKEGDVSGELSQGMDKNKGQRAGEQKPWLAMVRKWCVCIRVRQDTVRKRMRRRPGGGGVEL